jgi:alkylated DNA nucleotide flippase Atl1
MMRTNHADETATTDEGCSVVSPGTDEDGTSEESDEKDASEEFVGDVLEIVAAIPPGRVLTYGDVAGLVGRGGPRQVGQVMSRWGSSVPWWRVLQASGAPARGHEARALERYAEEKTPLRPDGERVDLRQARWDPEF